MKYEIQKKIIKLFLFSFLSISFNYLYPQSENYHQKFLDGGILNNAKLDATSQKLSVVFQDGMNGDNSISGLENRGWIVEDLDSGGDIPAWFQGNFYENFFSSFEGPENGYVASSWEGANDLTSILDHWLISPQITVSENDTISFWIQSPLEAGFDDSISIYLSPDGGSSISDFSLAYDDGSLTQRYFVPQGIWSNWRGILPFEGNIRFGIRYHTRNSDLNAWYIGIDQVEILSSGGNATSPTVATIAASNITTSSATLNGTINPNGSNTTYIFEYGTTNSYGNIVSSAQELTGTSDISVNSNIINLSPNTLYHYRIVATNEIGTTNGEDRTFTTTGATILSPTITTISATNITTLSANLNGSINPNNASTDYFFEFGTTTSYGTQTATKELSAGTSSISVNETISSLNPGTVYHYRLTAINSGGTSNSMDATFTTASTSSDIDLVLRQLLPSTHFWEVGSSINVDLTILNNGSTDAGSHSSKLYISTDIFYDISDISVGNPIAFPAIAAGDSATLREIFTVPSIASGGYYLLATVDVNNSVLETNEDNFYYNISQLVIGYPASIQVNTTLNFNNPDLTSSYRMIGIPGNETIPISQTLSGNYEEDWVAYDDNGNTSDYLVSYNGTSQFNFRPGKGFWILSEGAMAVNQSAVPVSLQYELDKSNNSDTYVIVAPINLQNGWNIISNPFEIDISWTEIKAINGISESIHSFSGSFTSSSIFEPYKGYYFYNSSNLSSIFIPYSINGTIPNLDKQIVDPGRSILITLSTNGKNKSSVNIGINEKSQFGYDKLDKFIPPGDFENSRISIFNKELETDYKFLINDFRNEFSNQIYNLNVKYPLNKKYKLDFNGIDNLNGMHIYLVDQNSIFHNLETEKNISLNSTSDINNLVLLIGDENFIETQRSALAPKEFRLGQNYPNPFNPTTSIIYSIPKQSEVTLEVFDILGRKVTTLVDMEQQQGNYIVQFNANNLTSGIYFYRIQVNTSEHSNNFVEIMKMIFMK